MKQKENVFRCSACGREEPKWLGRCPECGEWNTMREESRQVGPAGRPGPQGKTGGGRGPSGALSLPIASIDSSDATRIVTGIGEFDRVLGGGLARGSTTLVGGEPGIGKSTLLLQACARAGCKALYVTGEESAAQIRLRAERTDSMSAHLEVASLNELSEVLLALDNLKPLVAVIDSVQTIRSEEAGSVPGTVNQVKYCCLALGEWAREHGAALLLVAHVTKDGTIAGPKAAEHAVDAVLYFETLEGSVRELSASKNRFGSTEEIGLFSMGEKGLLELADPSGVFMTARTGDMPSGVACAIAREGSRCFMVELQALAAQAKAGFTRVYSDRVDAQRVSRIAAILERHAGVRFSDHDLYVNVAGGIRLNEPGIDLPLACALYSARTGLPLPPGIASCGELSLAGEVRSVRGMRRRAREACGLGFKRVFGPCVSNDGEKPEWESAPNVKDALRAMFGKGS